ncbi:MAG: hypothetical protein K6F61_01695 [Clostridiales bacterium]|nr:hypothetical protein [Clostridiales bacterium]
MNMIQYALPDFTVNLRNNLKLLELKRNNPELFFDDIEFIGMYGCFPGCIMNGGRLLGGNDKRYTYEEIVSTFDQINNEGLTIKLTLTNMFIRPEQYEDEYCSMILDAAKGRDAEVIVYQDELGDYIARKYHFKRILSTTRLLNGVEELNEMLERYDIVVLDYNHNKDDAFLGKVKDPARLEVMPNELCEPGCPNRQLHYKMISNGQLNDEGMNFRCPQKTETKGFTLRTETSPTILSNDDIRRLNKNYGIQRFKIVGRVNDLFQITESYLYYFIRPEYRAVLKKVMEKKPQF